MPEAARTYDSLNQVAHPRQYYVVDQARIPFRELWRSSRVSRRSVTYLLRVLFAKLRLQSLKSGPLVLFSDPAIVDVEDLSQTVRQQFQQEVGFLESAGFHPVFAIREELAKGLGDWTVALLSADRLVWSEITKFDPDNSKAIRSETIIRFNTLRENGHILCTANVDFSAWKHVSLEVISGPSTEGLLQVHRRRVRDCDNVKAVTEADMRSWVRSCLESEAAERTIEHGFVPATDAKIQRFRDEIVKPALTTHTLP